MDFIHKHTLRWIVPGAILLSIFASCKKDEQQQAKEVTINLPATLSLTYGEEKDIDIPTALTNQSNVNFSLAFTGNDNVQIDQNTKLHDKLAQAITVDRVRGKIHVNSNLLYPNAAKSTINGQQLPSSYKVTLMVNTTDQSLTGKQTVDVTIAPTKFNIKGLDNSADIPFAYVLYSDAGATFELDATGLPTTNTAWSLDKKGADSAIILTGNKIQFKANAGDPKKKAEQAYDLVSSFTKDGFEIATRKLRVIFIPQIKFFYGTYYPQYDLTILTNQVYIALSNAYVSAAPTLYPENYTSSFSITAIEKDGKAFDNKEGIFTLNTNTGAITVLKNTTLSEGSYKLTIKAVTTVGLEFSATMTLNMSKLEE
ncbi:cadherin repeat domain-containing protein [Chitinophaga skermanii]|nr:cadherin repeat domain-containing protein [Chitinophaga skermanii]